MDDTRWDKKVYDVRRRKVIMTGDFYNRIGHIENLDQISDGIVEGETTPSPSPNP